MIGRILRPCAALAAPPVTLQPDDAERQHEHRERDLRRPGEIRARDPCRVDTETVSVCTPRTRMRRCRSAFRAARGSGGRRSPCRASGIDAPEHRDRCARRALRARAAPIHMLSDCVASLSARSAGGYSVRIHSTTPSTKIAPRQRARVRAGAGLRKGRRSRAVAAERRCGLIDAAVSRQRERDERLESAKSRAAAAGPTRAWSARGKSCAADEPAQRLKSHRLTCVDRDDASRQVKRWSRDCGGACRRRDRASSGSFMLRG